MKPIERFNEIKPLLKMADDEQLMTLAKFLNERIKNPESYVVFLGETSSGKSSLINGILKSQVLDVKTCPTTGAITEIQLCDIPENEYYILYRNASMKKIDRNEFTRQTLEPDKEVQRVKVMLPNGGNKRSLRLFDTPGYDSIIDEHEEILTEFLPNSDVVVYTVSYRIGIQKTDYSFLSRARELIREDAQILLAINMCPEDCTESDRRISEIQKYVESVLHYKPQLFLIKTQPSADDYSYPIPDGKALYEGVIGCAESPGKLALVEDALNGYVDELYHKSSEIIAQRYMQAHLSEKQAADIRHEQKAASRRILDAIPDLVDPAFEKLIRTIRDKIRQAADNAYEKVCEDIDASKKGTMDEMRNFVCVHSIPFALDNETSEILRQEEIILDDLNEQLDEAKIIGERIGV